MISFSYTTDESPEPYLRRLGLRIQITWAYVVIFAPKDDWDLPQYRHTMPISRRQYLCDLDNCYGKRGVDVFLVLEMVLERIGLYIYNAAAGCGDGGGENEGAQGIHALCEQRNPSYVRRRCLSHMPWRIADQGLKEAAAEHKELKAISEYLHDGPAWMRLQAIAVQSVAAGGLGLCAAGDPLFQTLFRDPPPKDLAERPETTATLLSWLIARPLPILARLVNHDVAQRELTAKSAHRAAEALGRPRTHVRYRVLYVLLEKYLF